MKIKLHASKVRENGNAIFIEERFDETGINLGLFLVEMGAMAQKVDETEMPSMCTAMDIFNQSK